MRHWICAGLAVGALTLSAAVAPAEAQTVVGVKAGLAFADQSISDEGASVSFDSRTGFIGGAFAHLALGSPFYIQPEATYSSKGWSLESGGESGTLALDYIEIPVLFGAAFPLEGSAIRPAVFAGPSFGIKIRCDAEGTDCGDAYKGFDLGVAFGAGIFWTLDSVVLSLDGRYVLGLTDILDDEGEFPGASIKNRAWQFTVGAGIPVGG